MAIPLGVGVLYGTPAATQWTARAPLVVAVDCPELLAATPASIRVFRHYFANQDIRRPGADVLDDVLRALGAAPATHVCLFNETAQFLGQGLERHVALTFEAATQLQRVRPDLHLVGFRFSTGCPGPAEWAYLAAHAWGGCDVLGLNQYWGAAGFTPAHALRHRELHQATGGQHPPLLITECGRDAVEGGPGGWQAAGLTPTAYGAELLSYAAALAADRAAGLALLGAAIFTAGAQYDAQPQAWTAFDLDPIAPAVLYDAPMPAPPRGGTPMPAFELGFATYAAAHPDTVGEPVEDEWTERETPAIVRRQDTTTGRLRYYSATNRIVFEPFPDAPPA